jgi:hypothetical protein
MSTRLADNLSRKAISAGFILTGFVLMGPALTMVWMFGEGIGATWLEQRVYGSAHVSPAHLRSAVGVRHRPLRHR